jgi:hypothetical protein
MENNSFTDIFIVAKTFLLPSENVFLLEYEHAYGENLKEKERGRKAL